MAHVPATVHREKFHQATHHRQKLAAEALSGAEDALPHGQWRDSDTFIGTISRFNQGSRLRDPGDNLC